MTIVYMCECMAQIIATYRQAILVIMSDNVHWSRKVHIQDWLITPVIGNSKIQCTDGTLNKLEEKKNTMDWLDYEKKWPNSYRSATAFVYLRLFLLFPASYVCICKYWLFSWTKSTVSNLFLMHTHKLQSTACTTRTKKKNIHCSIPPFNSTTDPTFLFIQFHRRSIHFSVVGTQVTSHPSNP